MGRENQTERVLSLLVERPDLKFCYDMGRDAEVNGANEKNCHFTIFCSPDHTKAWEEGKNSAKSQCERVLELLGDGSWHSGLEFTRLPRPILSYTRRIHELRKDGHNIRRERRDGLWKYILTPTARTE